MCAHAGYILPEPLLGEDGKEGNAECERKTGEPKAVDPAGGRRRAKWFQRWLVLR
jgi:hypothetical protein